MTNKKIVLYAAIAALFAAGGAYVATQALSLPRAGGAGAASPAVQALYRQSLPDASGATQALTQWRGKALLVNFWAPWCGPCVEEMPELSALQHEVAGRNVQVIGIGIDSAANIADFAQRFKIAYPVYVGGMDGTELSRQLGNLQGGLPFTVLIDADGRVRKTYLGRLKFGQLRADLAAL